MVIWQQNNFGNNGVFSIEPAEINRCKNILIHLKTFASIVLSASWFSRLLFPPAPWLFFLLCFFFRVFFPCWNDSAVDYQTQIALIAGTNWKESIPGAECICLPVQKWASVPYLTSSGKGAKKPLCRRPLNSALNHTLGRFLSDEATEQADDVRKKHCTYAPPPPLDARDHGGNHPRRRMEIQQSNWCTPPFGWDKIWGTMKHLSRRKRRENDAFVDAASTTLHNCSLCWVLWIGTDWGAAFSILGMLLTSIRGLLIFYTVGCLNAHKGWILSVKGGLDCWPERINFKILYLCFLYVFIVLKAVCMGVHQGSQGLSALSSIFGSTEIWVSISNVACTTLEVDSRLLCLIPRLVLDRKELRNQPCLSRIAHPTLNALCYCQTVQTDVFYLATGLEVELRLNWSNNRCWYWHSSYHQSPIHLPIQML